MSFHKFQRRFGLILYPFSLLYGLLVTVRNKLFDWNILKGVNYNFPVICIGNITVGGTGKTPHVEYLVNLLQKDFNIGVLSRGYKRKTKGYVLATKKSSPDDIGDEPYQLKRKHKKLNVAVCEKRTVGIENLQKDVESLQGVLLDDAYQHRYVKPGVSILLIDYHRPIYKDFMLPYGSLRDSKSQLHRANIVIVTKVPGDIKPIEKRIWIKKLKLRPYQFLYFSTYQYGHLTPVFKSSKGEVQISDLKNHKASVLLVTGIANPKPLKKYLSEYKLNVEERIYPDHHDYTLKDIEEIRKKFKAIEGKYKLIITTEKDAVKLQHISDFPRTFKEKLFYIPIEVKIMDGKRTEFEKNIISYVKKNKEISRLHK
ncbi:MAG: tetraacyldisaccharide 4'-kinase [Bacteroidales bacterium]|nr:tetraacyldisaccharide 4'-kinase [Bacteroidales bacterium]